VACSLAVAGSVILDRKWKMEEDELNQLRRKQSNDIIVQGNVSGDLLEVAAKVKLRRHNDSVLTQLLYSANGLQAIQMSFTDEPVEVFLASVDLCRYEVLLDTGITEKERPTSFAKRYDADIVVNGEAGTSPGLDAPLGQWTGNYIVKGKPIMMKDSDKRPFVYFNRNSKAYYSNDREVITEPTEEMYDAIWGRFDLIQNGKIDIDERDQGRKSPYPRTVVGIDSTGLKLFLMVADGRRPNYSIGLTMQECGELLLPFGVHWAMACDQGGSTSMYIRNMGIVNRPADGVERRVYTFLGLRDRYRPRVEE
jgi:hypothetical protein